MLRLVFLVLFVLVDTEDLLGVNYSFDVDFYTNFNSCDNVNVWRLVRYKSLDIQPPYIYSDKAIQAVGECCAQSFPIIFVGGTLEINVYVQDISAMLNLRIDVYDENDTCITKYVYRPSRNNVIPGWQTISLHIIKHVKGYIYLRGKSLKNEILLIDSFQYTPNNTLTNNGKRSKRSVDTEDEDELIFGYKPQDNYGNERFVGSGDGENDMPPPADQPEEPERRDTFWNPFTISLVSFGVVVAVALFVVGAYHYGKIKAVDNPLLVLDEEPPRTIIIPRVISRSRSSRSSPITLYGSTRS